MSKESRDYWLPKLDEECAIHCKIADAIENNESVTLTAEELQEIKHGEIGSTARYTAAAIDELPLSGRCEYGFPTSMWIPADVDYGLNEPVVWVWETTVDGVPQWAWAWGNDVDCRKAAAILARIYLDGLAFIFGRRVFMQFEVITDE